MVGSTARVPQISVLTVWATAAFFATASVAWAQATNLDAAKKEGKVVIYGTIVPQVMTLIEKGFEGKYGLKIEYWRADATKVIDRVLTEWRAGKPGFDIVIGARGASITGEGRKHLREIRSYEHGQFSGKIQRRGWQAHRLAGDAGGRLV